MGEQGSGGGEKTELRALVFGVQTRWKLSFFFLFFLSGACLSSLQGMKVGSEVGGWAQRERELRCSALHHLTLGLLSAS